MVSEDKLAGVDDAAPLPVKKNKGFFSGWKSMTYDNKKNVVIFFCVIAAVIWWSFSADAPVQGQVVTEDTTGDDYVSAKIDLQGAELAVESNDNAVVENKRMADEALAEHGDVKGYSGAQDVEYGEWLIDTPPPSASTNNFQVKEPQLNVDPFKNSQNTRSGSEVADTVNIGNKITELLALQKSKNAAPSPLPSANESGQQVSRSSVESSQTNRRGQAVPTVASREITPSEEDEALQPQGEKLKRTILPGDQLACKLPKAINSDVSRQTTCTILGTPLDGGHITLKISREIDYVYLAANYLVFGNDHISIQGAIAVDVGDVAANGLRDDVDYHRLVRYSALMLAGAGQAVTDLVGQPQTRQTLTNNTTVLETVKASDRDIIIASLLRPAQVGTENLMETFRTPPTVFLEKDRIVHIYFTEPVDASWMPDMRINRTKRFKLREYE